MIVSASRRTDLPAFCADWFARRLQAGYADVANPFNPKQIRRVPLAPGEVTAFVFWTRDPRPFLPVLDILDERGDRYYFQFTLTAYGRDLEPGLGPQRERLDAFVGLAERLGPERVLWRYDPIILSSRTPAEFHRQAFAGLCARLAGHTRRVTISLVEYYRKVDRRLRALEEDGVTFDRQVVNRPETLSLIAEMAATAREHDMEMVACASPVDLCAAGVTPGACVDGGLIERLWNIHVPAGRDRGQRAACRCTPSRDIGTNGTCRHGCLYCYANP